MSDKNYKSENPSYEIPEAYTSYPQELTFGGETPDAAIKNAMEQLIAEPTNATACRHLDDVEITTIRGEYTTLLENEKPEAEAILDGLLVEDARLKEQIKAQREALYSIAQQVNDKIRIIKDGTAREALNPATSMRVAVDGRYLHYTLVGGRFILAKVEEVSTKDQGNIFTRQTKNQEVFIRMFGCDFNASGLFEQIEVSPATKDDLNGRKLAAAAVNSWREDFTDEDTGEIVTVERSDKIIERDTILDAEDVEKLLEENVASVVVYKLKGDDAEAGA